MKFKNYNPKRIGVINLLALNFLLVFSSCQQEVKSDYSGVPSQIISVKEAVAMKKEYKTTIDPLIAKYKSTPKEMYDATEFAYIDLDSLKKYIAFLDEVKRVNKQKITGIRIYYGVHSKTDFKYPNRETVFFAPTIKVASTALSKKHPILENLPFSIHPNGSNPLIGGFKIVSGLLFKKDNTYGNSKRESNTKKRSETSVFLDNLGATPPPKSAEVN
jgi:hypothetical protein